MVCLISDERQQFIRNENATRVAIKLISDCASADTSQYWAVRRSLDTKNTRVNAFKSSGYYMYHRFNIRY